MDSVSMDHYEKQLYTVFKTFDVDNEESLDRSAVLDLCNTLQLEDKGSSLVDTLFDRPTEKVTFTQFRNGLLTVLGGGDASASAPLAHSDDDSSGREVAPKFVYGSKKYGRRSKPQTISNVPRNTEFEQHKVSSSDKCANDMATTPKTQDDKCDFTNHKENKLLMENLNKNIQNEIIMHCDLDHDRLIDYEESVALCHSLHMDKIDRQMIELIFKEASGDSQCKMMVGEFFHRLNTSLTISIASCDNDHVLSNEVVLNDHFESNDRTIAMGCVIEMWEKSGVEHGKRLLHDLGFTSPMVNLPEVTSALEEELRILTLEEATMDARALLLQALIVLYRLQVSKTKYIMEQIVAENNKLKNDLNDANRRAQVLAQEVDENHARMESSLINKIKQLDLKHAESMKTAVNDWVAEKEKMSGIIIQLENTTTRLSAEENRMRIENSSLQKQMEELKKKVMDDEERLSELEMIRVQLTKELKSLVTEQNERKQNVEEQSMIQVLSSQVENLRLENKMLRDRNDELCAEVDSMARSTRDWRRQSLSRSAPHSLDISSEQAASWLDEAEGAENGDRPSKRRGDSPSHAFPRLDDDSPRVGKLRKKLSTTMHCDVLDGYGFASCEADSSSDGPCSLSAVLPLQNFNQNCDTSTEPDQTIVSHMDIMRRLNRITENLSVPKPDASSCESCNTLYSILTMIQEQIKGYENSVVNIDGSCDSKLEKITTSVQTDVEDSEIEKLKDEMVQAHKQYEEEKLKLTNLVKELETSLDQLKSEYDKSEEYWTGKLDEEREMYNEEQRLSDERLTELITKIAEYEQQFSPRSGLPTIDEKYSLEIQVTDLEEEYNNYKKEKEKDLTAKTEEISRLKEKVQSLEHLCGSNLVGLNTSGASSPIEYLWNQGTIHTPFKKQENEKRNSVRDYQNPAYIKSNKEDTVMCSSDSEKDKAVTPIQRPALTQRSISVGSLQDGETKPPKMIQCSELEGQLRKQHLVKTPVNIQSIGGECACAALEQRCRQMHAALRHQQLYLDSVQRTAQSETATLRARIAGAEAAVTRLQQRLTAADLLVKELYLENCQLAHRDHSRLL